jgi:exopolyphosphatase/guanosine-5'-triphosphate,3'-diphosphate pyrophosphatase
MPRSSAHCRRSSDSANGSAASLRPRSAPSATNSLRVAKNSRDFLIRAEHALGFPIEVVAGKEEARLIYLGVSHSLPPTSEKRMVVDIGGGSTEFIIGAGYRPQKLESLYMGCVSYTLKYFADGRITKGALRAAEMAARVEVQTIENEFARGHWQQAVGSSGTARALADLIAANGWGEGTVTVEGLDKLRAQLLKVGEVDRVSTLGLKADRAQVLPGGFAIMAGLFAELGVEEMVLANGAMRQGILYDMLGRLHHRDMRDTTVRQFAKRYHVDLPQARRVEVLAADLLEALTGRKGQSTRHDGPPSSRGPRTCTRSASPSRTPVITSIRRTSSATPTCPASRAWNRRTSRCSCSRIAARSSGWRRSMPAAWTGC